MLQGKLSQSVHTSKVARCISLNSCPVSLPSNHFQPSCPTQPPVRTGIQALLPHGPWVDGAWVSAQRLRGSPLLLGAGGFCMLGAGIIHFHWNGVLGWCSADLSCAAFRWPCLWMLLIAVHYDFLLLQPEGTERGCMAAGGDSPEAAAGGGCGGGGHPGKGSRHHLRHPGVQI